MADLPRSPLAPPGGLAALPAIAGARFATAEAGVRYSGRADVMLAILAPGTTVAGVFTRSATRAAPVLDCEAKLGRAPEAGACFLVNAGNANAFTGRAGTEAVASLCAALSRAAGVPEARIFTSSTGVIGEPLPHERIEAVLETLLFEAREDRLADAAEAIRTTDTFAKGAAATVRLAGGEVAIAGIAKGSGMIAPDMATMLAYVFTDARVEQETLQRLLSAHVETSFNAITVDGDTSTSDTLLLAATGGSGTGLAGDEDEAAFGAALAGVLKDLALQVVRDGEGATKLIEVRVSGAQDGADARRVALSIANSPLVKTAFAGEDANWGRIVMAVGKSGAVADRDRLSIRFGDLLVAENGQRAPGYVEAEAAAYMKGAELSVSVDLGLGEGAATIWTCDLTHGYISINADYRS
jgi:glutamate N-acetyltransferase/amino-acid N-acetyltransferase